MTAPHKGRINLWLILALFFVAISTAQAGYLRGRIVDKATGEPLISATILLKNQADTTQTRYASTGKDGGFEIKYIDPGTYKATCSYLGYTSYTMAVQVTDQARDLGNIGLDEAAEELDAVEVKGTAARAVQRGDTIDFNAAAYKVSKDATTEDLLKKLPGVTVEGGTVKTQGENVKKVLVDGKPFFGDDPTIAIRNLPADVIDRIEVYDQMSDQSQLTGFDDGEGVKAINIVTKANRRVGQFGRVQAGLGYDDTQNEMRYAASGNLSLFQGQRRLSIIGMSNNVNQQNFSSEDMAALSSSGRGRRDGAAFGGTGNGIATTHALGLNYADMWGKKTEATASYFFNYSDLLDESKRKREYFTGRDTTNMYHSLTRNTSRTQNHRLNLRIDHKFNTNTSLLLVPVASVQLRDANNHSADTMLGISRTDNRNTAQVDNFNLSNMLLLRHKLAKPGRTVSAMLMASISDANTYNELYNYTFFELDQKEEKRDQQSKNPTNNWSWRSNVAYTEPLPDLLGGQNMIQANYNFNYSFGESNTRAYNLNTLSNLHEDLDSIFSNIYANHYYTHRAGANYMYRTAKANASVGVNYEVASLDGTQHLPVVLDPRVHKRFYTWLPSARYEYQFTKQKSFRAYYRVYTNAPSVNQLQNVIDISNPLLITSGNPALKQSTNHMVNLRYNQTTVDKGFTFFAMVSGGLTNQYIATHTLIASRDTNLSPIPGDTLWLRRGSQYSVPVNIAGYEYRTAQGSVTVGVPVKWISSNLNLSSNAAYTRRPGLINSKMNISENYNLSQGVVVSSNVSEQLDFNVGYSAYYNITANTLQTGQNNNYFRHNVNLRLNWEFWRGIVLQTTLNYDQYKGLAVAYNEEFTRWDASIGKKLLKSQRLELRLSVYDILNQMQNFSRNVTATYIEDVTAITLYRYVMVSAVYTLRSMGTPPKRSEEGASRGDRPPRNPDEHGPRMWMP